MCRTYQSKSIYCIVQCSIWVQSGSVAGVVVVWNLILHDGLTPNYNNAKDILGCQEFGVRNVY